MEEDAASMVSSTKMNHWTPETTSDSNSDMLRVSNKRARLHHHSTHDSTMIINNTHNKFKGVVPQQNGRWGAQIYAHHQRIWLGTFKSEKEAAMAYDSASIKIRNGGGHDTHRNFPWTYGNNIQEPIFQNKYSTEAVLNMIRDGTYQPKFADFLRVYNNIHHHQAQRDVNHHHHGGNNSNSNIFGYNYQIMVVNGDEELCCRQLFQKELTPSDVGKLNRLVIPKKYAVKYFPYICENSSSGGGVEDMELVFYDRLMKTWKFRYCFWSSSQSYVFTRGWNRFVKEMKLKEKDIVTFYACDHQGTSSTTTTKSGKSFFLVDVIHCDDHDDQGEQSWKILSYKDDDEKDLVKEEEDQEKQLTLNIGLESTSNLGDDHEKGFRLFGVLIN